jgi:hypothetical protein
MRVNFFWQVTVVIVFLSLRLLLIGNVGSGWNEVDILPLAKHYADPDWISQDWYLNQTASYRLLFQNVIGWFTINFGFLVTSIIGRLVCYSLVALGIVIIGHKLRLSFALLLLATICSTYSGYHQGMIAREWLVGGLEPKAFAYGLILIAIALMLSKRYFAMTLLLGLATSFHVLVGGWAFLTTLGWLCLRPHKRLFKLRQIGFRFLLLYVIASAFAIPALFQQLLTTTPISSASISPSYIYVFLRLSHHLNPLSWDIDAWIDPLIYLLLLGISIVLLRLKADKTERDYAAFELGEFALVSLVPFLGGLAIAPFDHQGDWLQYYPFRFADVILPFTACFLTAYILESYLAKSQKIINTLLCLILLVILGIQATIFTKSAIALQQFPSQEQDVDPQWKVMSNWIRYHTPKDALIVSHPVDLSNFTWLTERATIAKFKLLPQTKTKILEYYKRLDDLSGNSVLDKYVSEGKVSKRKTMRILSDGFEHLTKVQAEELMSKYQANYFLTNVNHPLDLKTVYRYDPYVLYKR